MSDDDGYIPPPIEVIRERLAAREAETRRQADEWFESRSNGTGRPTRTRTVGPVTRERLRKATIAHYAKKRHPSKLRALRYSRTPRLTLEDVAQAANVGQRVVWVAENQPEKVGDRTWKRLADALGVAVEEIKP